MEIMRHIEESYDIKIQKFLTTMVIAPIRSCCFRYPPPLLDGKEKNTFDVRWPKMDIRKKVDNSGCVLFKFLKFHNQRKHSLNQCDFMHEMNKSDLNFIVVSDVGVNAMHKCIKEWAWSQHALASFAGRRGSDMHVGPSYFKFCLER